MDSLNEVNFNVKVSFSVYLIYKIPFVLFICLCTHKFHTKFDPIGFQIN